GQGDELAAPAVDRAEVARDRAGDRLRQRPAIAAQTGEIEFVQQGRVEGDELIALQAVDHVGRRRRRVERLELLRDGVEAIERAAVVDLIVTLDQARRHAVQGPGSAEQGGKVIAHGGLRAGCGWTGWGWAVRAPR